MNRPRPNFKLGLSDSRQNDNLANENTTNEFVVDGTTYDTCLNDIHDIEDCPHPIGSGRFGTVYKKHHKQSGKTMAEKVVNKGSVQLTKYADTEKKLWKVCKNEFLVNHYGAIDTVLELRLYFELMASCFRKILDEVKHRAKESDISYVFPPQVLKKIAYSTWAALWYLKEHHNVIHRDIKPSNILVGFDGSIKVTDFGLARKLVDSKAFTKGIGALGYISPERIQFSDKTSYGSPADVWSLGIMLIELATGDHPILNAVADSSHELSVLIQIADKDPPSLTGDHDDGLKDFTAACLKKDPDERLALGSRHYFLEGSIPSNNALKEFILRNDLCSLTYE